MTTQPHIVWKGLPPSEALAQQVREELALLDKTYRRIIASRVVIEQPHKHHHQGGHYQVKIELTVPGRVLVVARDPEEHANSQDAYAAVKEAFWTMRRQLEDHVRLRRGYVKHHTEPQGGVVSKLVPEEDCGFITSDEGDHFYFHKNSVLGQGWRRLGVGDRVRFASEEGDLGPQASSVHLVGGRRHPS